MTRRVLLLPLLLLLLLLPATRAAAFPTLLRHGYASCQACHVDPSGAGALTAYGRAQSDLLVAWHLTPLSEEEEPAAWSRSLFGVVPLPEIVDVGGNLRGGGIAVVSTSGEPVLRPLLMASDVSLTVDTGVVVAHASVGYGLRNVGPAVVISPDGGPDNAIVSRVHWIGARFADDALVLRAGRLPIPFGLRNVEHTTFVRAATRSSIDVDQQHGVAASWNSEGWRAELMGIAGNFQLRPDAFRERGYAGFVEWSPLPSLSVGASSLLTWAAKDRDAGLPLLRQAHGFFGRWSPAPLVVVLAEGDLVAASSSAQAWGVGGAGLLQVDVEPLQGVHLVPALEAQQLDGTAAWPTAGAWLSAVWHPLAHVELRADTSWRQVSPGDAPSTGTFVGLLQLHVFL